MSPILFFFYGGMQGITTYIQGTLARGTKFTRFVKRGALKSSRAGLEVGRAVDRAFTEHIKRGTRPSAKYRARIAAIFRALADHGVSMTGSQFAVQHPESGLRTHADGVGVTKAGAGAVVELKCTTATLSAHKAMYHTACSACPVLRSGCVTEPNSEYVRHQLQLGFAIFASPDHSTGVVVVSCVDGVAVYRCNASLSERHWFMHRDRSAPARRKAPANTVDPTILWPSATGHTAFPGNAVQAVSGSGKVALLAQGSAAAIRVAPSKLSRRQRRGLAELLSVFPAPQYVVYPGQGGWRRGRARLTC